MDLGQLLHGTNPMFVDVALLIGRVAIGVCFVIHALGKAGVMKPFMPPPPQPPPPSPFAWGRTERLRELLGESFELEFETGTNRFRYGSGKQAYELWVNHYGPSKALAASLDDVTRAEFKGAMIGWHETFPSPLGYEQPREYVITRAIRK